LSQTFNYHPRFPGNISAVEYVIDELLLTLTVLGKRLGGNCDTKFHRKFRVFFSTEDPSDIFTLFAERLDENHRFTGRWSVFREDDGAYISFENERDYIYFKLRMS
jgi:hypothetical protein